MLYSLLPTILHIFSTNRLLDLYLYSSSINVNLHCTPLHVILSPRRTTLKHMQQLGRMQTLSHYVLLAIGPVLTRDQIATSENKTNFNDIFYCRMVQCTIRHGMVQSTISDHQSIVPVNKSFYRNITI